MGRRCGPALLRPLTLFQTSLRILIMSLAIENLSSIALVQCPVHEQVETSDSMPILWTFLLGCRT
jgi:hypothetical protein